jgi:hypothetical protein
MKVYLELVHGYDWHASNNMWMLRYEYDQEQTGTMEHEGKWVKYVSLCRPDQLDISKAIAYLELKELL